MSSFFLSFRIIPLSWYVVILSFTNPFPSILSSTSTIFDPALPYLHSTPSNALSHAILLLPSPFQPSIHPSIHPYYFHFFSFLIYSSILFYYFSPLLTLFLPSLPLASPPLIFLFSSLLFSSLLFSSLLFSSLHSSSLFLFLPTPPSSSFLSPPLSPPLYIGGGRCRGIQRCLLLESIRAHCVCREAINRGNAIRSNSSEKQNKSP